jgi:hypothetical protein
MDSSNRQMFAGVKAVSENQVIIYFTAPVSGTANFMFYI